MSKDNREFIGWRLKGNVNKYNTMYIMTNYSDNQLVSFKFTEFKKFAEIIINKDIAEKARDVLNDFNSKFNIRLVPVYRKTNKTPSKNKYRFEIKHTRFGILVIEANSKEEAESIMQKKTNEDIRSECCWEDQELTKLSI
jgi:AICAR transformylase/IMP cyclohydrolase PurH